MTLPSLLPPRDILRVDFQPGDLARPDQRLGEPGTWWNLHRHDLISGCFPQVTQIVDLLLAGDDPATGDFVLTVEPITSQSGPASADAMAPANISFTAAADSLEDVVLGLIDAYNDGSDLLTGDDLANWNRIRSYVLLEVGGTAETLRVTSVAAGNEFNVTLAVPAANTATPTTVAAPSTSTIKVGFYCAIDRTQGTNGFDQFGQPFLKEIEASTPEADIVGPVYLGDGTEPVTGGFPYREFVQRKDVPLTSYGQILAYAELAIPTASIDERVYVRHTGGGDFLSGMAATQARAEVGATAAVVTVTPVAADSTLYEYDVIVDGATIGTVSYTSSAAPATADEIANAYRTQLAAISSTYFTQYGVVPYTLDAVFGSPVVVTGRDDGASVVLTPTAANVGDNGIVATTPAVSTHRRLLTRRDRFLAESVRIGSAPVDVPHSNA